MDNKKPTYEEMVELFYGTNNKPQKTQDAQREIYNALCSGVNTLAMLPTGSGKSFCYQAPACALPGKTIIVSPLAVLIQDQVESFNQRAKKQHVKINGFRPKAVDIKDYSLDDILNDKKIKLIYVTPERLAIEKYRREFKKAGWFDSGIVSMIAIDEVHCMSQWGFDFRENYLKIREFINMFEGDSKPVVSGFTATATRFDIDNIKETLKIKNEVSNMTPRNNLKIDIQNEYLGEICNKDVVVRTKIMNKLNELLDKNTGDTIIYCKTRATVDRVAQQLTDRPNSDVMAFHAGKRQTVKDAVYKRVITRNAANRLIIVATNAFGMGVDKKDFRCVINVGYPTSIEDYYQEIGRAGRDGKEANCILLNVKTVDMSDSDTTKGFILSHMSESDKKKLQNLRKFRYAKLVSVLKDNDVQKKILEYFENEYLLSELDISFGTLGKKAEKIMNKPYEFHINNSPIANMIRSGDYDCNENNSVESEEWRSKKIPKLKFKKNLNNRYLVYGKSIFWHDMVLIKRADGKKITTAYLNGTFKKQYLREIKLKNDPYYAAVEDNKIVRIYKVSKKQFVNITDTGKFDIGNEELPIKNYVNTSKDNKGIIIGEEIFKNKGEVMIAEMPGPRSYKCSFKLDTKLTYWDMMVADAVYSVMNKTPTADGKEKILKLRDVIRLLMGKIDVNMQYGREDVFANEVKNSIDKMIGATLKIDDKKTESFLPLTEKDTYTYSYEKKPLLYTFAEEKGGEIIKFPSHLMETGSRKKEARIITFYLIHRAYIYRKTKRGQHIDITSGSKFMSIFGDESKDSNESRARTKRCAYIDASLKNLRKAKIIKYKLIDKAGQELDPQNQNAKDAVKITLL